MPIYSLFEKTPQIASTVYIHPDAVIIGDVRIADHSSVWPCAVLRGDSSHISIGTETSIQDGTVIHCREQAPTIIGNRCVIGHNAHLEGCIISDECLIGSGSTVLEFVKVGTGALVAAGSVVTPGKQIPDFALAMGVPVKIKENTFSKDDFKDSVENYLNLSEQFKKGLKRID
jgi:carbonic anhydrase/acetyltransferase-like protein (isoleucine patch superfamily)